MVWRVYSIEVLAPGPVAGAKEKAYGDFMVRGVYRSSLASRWRPYRCWGRGVWERRVRSHIDVHKYCTDQSTKHM